MSRYIDADALTETIRNFVDTMSVCTSTEYCTGLRFMKKQAIEAVESAPTVDAVQVVRCKDCKHHEVFKNGVNGWCNGHGCPADVTYFCADAERRTDGK